MGIEMVGIDHSVAEIDIRMIFSFTKKSTRELFEEIKNVPGIAGCVLLSTCNRMELWISTEPDWDGDLYGLLCSCLLYTSRGNSATVHWTGCGGAIAASFRGWQQKRLLIKIPVPAWHGSNTGNRSKSRFRRSS